MGRDRFIFHVPLAMRGRSVAYRFSCSAVASTRIGYRMAGYGHRRYADREPRDGGEGAAGAGELSGRLGKAIPCRQTLPQFPTVNDSAPAIVPSRLSRR